METIIARSVLVRLLGLLLAVISVGAVGALPANASTTPATATAAEPADAPPPCAYVRLYRATAGTGWAQKGGVDTTGGQWIGSDYYTGGTVYPSRLGGFDHLAFHGNNLVPFTRPTYNFRNPFTGEVRVNNPGVSYNGVMRDDNYDYPNNRVRAVNLLPPGVWEVRVAFEDECDGATYFAFIGNVQL